MTITKAQKAKIKTEKMNRRKTFLLYAILILCLLLLWKQTVLQDNMNNLEVRLMELENANQNQDVYYVTRKEITELVSDVNDIHSSQNTQLQIILEVITPKPRPKPQPKTTI